MDNDPNAPPTAKKVGKASNAEGRNDIIVYVDGAIYTVDMAGMVYCV